MGWDADENEEDYIDYVTREQSGFLGGLPVRWIGVHETLEMLVYGPLNGDGLLLFSPQTRDQTRLKKGQRHGRSA